MYSNLVTMHTATKKCKAYSCIAGIRELRLTIKKL